MCWGYPEGDLKLAGVNRGQSQAVLVIFETMRGQSCLLEGGIQAVGKRGQVSWGSASVKKNICQRRSIGFVVFYKATRRAALAPLFSNQGPRKQRLPRYSNKFLVC